MGKVRNKLNTRLKTSFCIFDDGMVMMDEQMYLSNNMAFKEEVLNEAYKSILNIHPGSIKM